MPGSMDARFEELARKARRVQDAVDGVRARAVVDGVDVEVAADGRITTLTMPDPAVAQSVSRAHGLALGRALKRAAALREELTSDPSVARALRHLVRTTVERSDNAASPPTSASPPDPADIRHRPLPVGSDRTNPAVSQRVPVGSDDDTVNRYALPPRVRRRYGLT
ncbi:hypothetical protein GPX89_19025 [Nocardia sp. ET3-3]|uniref:YbaB/EbfC family DNA-binding protein n=1 Tax=Nocardia terrae TaxID=2675851 RepID=A0A7K1UYD9_9NOCA|nr:hypothetical protein [Nocardia terrae]MVU79325.1 hypothetical protein [Nocardia terrae]